MIEFILKDEVPAKKNSKIMNTKTHRMFPSERYRAWHDYAALALKPKIHECIKDKCYIILLCNHGDRRRRDADNSVSSIFDALVDFGALEDDNWFIIRNHHVFNTFEQGNPWCKIMIFKPEEKDLYRTYVNGCIDLYE